MSKRLILVLSLVIIVIAMGFGFWFWKMRQSQPASISSTTQSGSVEGGVNQYDPTKVSTLTAPSVVNSPPQNTSKKTVSSDSIPQMGISMGGEPQQPLITYQGRTMTQEEYKKAWATSSTNKGDVNVKPPVKPIPSSDMDKDGLTYDQELTLGTDPNNADTDGDGLTDGEEVNTHKTSPKNFDTDGDGLTDGEEVKTYKTNPLKKDTDGDTYSDGVEVKGGYNPLGSGKLKQ